MKSAKLAKLGRTKREQARRNWIESQLKDLLAGPSEKALLEVSYPDWCQGLQIKTPDGMKPFCLYDWQLQTAEKLLGGPGLPALKGRQVVLLSSRQTGKTSMLLTMTDYMARAREQLTAILIHRTGDDAHDLCRRLKRFVGTGDFKTDNLSLLEYKSTGSVCYFRSANPNRGEEGAIRAGQGISSADWIVIEESQDCANIESVIGMVGPAATHGNPKLFVLVGTAGSKQSYFYQQLSKAAGSSEQLETILGGIRAGTESPFQILDPGKGPVAIISNWRCIPEFAAEPDFLSRIQDELGLSDSDIAKHYEMCFDSGGNSAAFEFAHVMAAQVDAMPAKTGSDEVFYVGVDPCGDGADYACAMALHVGYEVIEGEDKAQRVYTVCGLYRRRTGTAEQHLNKIVSLIDEHQPLTTAVEKNSMGIVWLETLAGIGLQTDIEGFSTTKKSKQMLIGRLQIALELGVLRIPKGPIIDELLAYRRLDGGSYGAGGKAHDDSVMALALALHASGFNRNF